MTQAAPQAFKIIGRPRFLPSYNRRSDSSATEAESMYCIPNSKKICISSPQYILPTVAGTSSLGLRSSYGVCDLACARDKTPSPRMPSGMARDSRQVWFEKPKPACHLPSFLSIMIMYLSIELMEASWMGARQFLLTNLILNHLQASVGRRHALRHATSLFIFATVMPTQKLLLKRDNGCKQPYVLDVREDDGRSASASWC